jgi:sigma-B regulation protein RsbU (phosphoserine phosphatase)
LNKRKDLPVEHMLSGVKASVYDFFGEADQFDDITMLSLEYIGKGGTLHE